jgi:hypothetical protein
VAAVLADGLRERLGPLFEGFAEPLYVWRRLDGDLVLVGYNETAGRLPFGRVGELLGRRPARCTPSCPTCWPTSRPARAGAP